MVLTENPIILTPTGVTATDTAAMDAAVTLALSSKRPVVMLAGTFQRSTAWDLRGNGLQVRGAGRGATVVKQMTANTAGIMVGRYYQSITDFTVINNAQSPSTDTAANGVEFYKSGWSTYARLEVNLFARGMMIPQANYNDGLTTTGNYVFSCVFESNKITGFSIKAIDQTAYLGGNTGSLWRNTFVSNNYSGSIAACTENVVKFTNCDEMVIDQMNIEWCSNAATDILGIESVTNCTIRGLHFEQLTLSAWGSSLVRPYASQISILGLTAVWCTITNSGPHAVVKLSTAGDSVVVTGFRQHDMTAAGPWALCTIDAGAAGGSAWFLQCTIAAPFTAATLNELAPMPVVKQINETLYAYKNAAGKNEITGTAAPTTGTWAVGDTCWNSAPAAAGTPGWVCTTGGTPGTWKAMAALAA